MANAVPYTKTQTFNDGDDMVETVVDADTEVSFEAEFTAIQNVFAAIPGIFASSTLTLKGGLDFNDKGITNLASINDHIFFVDGYGADPTGASDSRTATINAINAAIAAGGGQVVFGVGTYSFSAEINMGSDVTGTDKPLIFRGQGQNLTDLEVTNAGTGIFDMNSDYGDVEFFDLTFSTNSSATGSSTLVQNITDDTQFTRCILRGDHTQSVSALTFSTSTTNTNFLMDGCTVTGQFSGSPVLLYRTRDGRIVDTTFDLSTSTPLNALRVGVTSGNMNENLQILNCIFRRTAGSSAGTIVIDDTHTLLVRIVNPNITHTAAIAAIEAGTSTNLEITGGVIDFNDDTNIAAVEILGDDIRINGLEIIGNGGSCEAQAFATTGADSLQLVNCRVTGFNGATTGNVFTASTVTNTLIVGNNFTDNNAVTYPIGATQANNIT